MLFTWDFHDIVSQFAFNGDDALLNRSELSTLLTISSWPLVIRFNSISGSSTVGFSAVAITVTGPISRDSAVGSAGSVIILVPGKCSGVVTVAGVGTAGMRVGRSSTAVEESVAAKSVSAAVEESWSLRADETEVGVSLFSNAQSNGLDGAKADGAILDGLNGCMPHTSNPLTMFSLLTVLR